VIDKEKEVQIRCKFCRGTPASIEVNSRCRCRYSRVGAEQEVQRFIGALV
jgi:hypothetical protein